MSKDKEQIIEFRFKFPETYNTGYVNGAFGGANQAGEFNIHFYHERTPVPYAIEHKIEEGVLSDPMVTKPDTENHLMVRYVQSGITVSYDSMRIIRDWMNKQIEDFEKKAGINND
jgi:hypothetical protein